MGWKVRKERLQTDSDEQTPTAPTAVAPEAPAAGDTHESSVFDLSGTAFEDQDLHFEDAPVLADSAPEEAAKVESLEGDAEYHAGGAFDTLEQFLAARAEAEAAEGEAKSLPETELPFSKPPRKSSKSVPPEEIIAETSVPLPENAQNGHMLMAEDVLPMPSFELAPAPPFDLETPTPTFDLSETPTETTPPAEPIADAPAPEETLSWLSPQQLPDSDIAENVAQEEPTVALNRDAAAASLVSVDPQSGLPKVAPFIVDLPETASVPSALGRLTLRIRNLSAHFDLVKDVTLIGRPDTATRTYPDVEIEFDDSVSRKHAEVRKRDGKFYLIDLGSTNGVLLNGQKIAPRQEQLLTPGDRIRVGERSDLLFE